MARRAKTPDLITQFVDRMCAELRDARVATTGHAIKRRKLRTVTRECGLKKASLPFLQRLRRQLAQAGVFTAPSLTDLGLNPGDWVRFSTGPFPSAPLVFAKEVHLQRLVLASLGQGIFQNLKPFRSKGNTSGMEYRLPDGRRIDLLCQERTKHRAGTLVAIELKRQSPKKAVRQLCGYLDALEKKFAGRRVRGIVISSDEDDTSTTKLPGAGDHDIEWYRYRVEFEQQRVAR